MRNPKKKRSILAAGMALTAILSAVAIAADEQALPKPVYLYKTTFVRAAPGKLLDLIALWKDRLPVIEAAGDARPFWWRHTQGDQWDLMILTPMASYTDYYAKGRVAKRDKAAAAAGLPWADFGRRLDSCSAWKEDVFVWGRRSNSSSRPSQGRPTTISRSWSRCRGSRPSFLRNGRWRTPTASPGAVPTT
jgi:hypothetical protein